MNNKNYLFLLSVLIVFTISISISCKNTTSGKPISLTLQSWAPVNDGTYKAAKNFADLVKEATAGKLNFQVFPSGKKVPKGKEFEGVISGMVDAVHGPPGWTTDHLIGATFFTHWVGGLTPNQIEMWMKLEGREIAQKLYKKIGVQYVGIMTLSPPEVWLHSKKPLNSINDIKGLSIRIGGGDVQAIFKKMGAAPVLLPGSEIYNSAKTGAIQAFEYINPAVNINMKFHEVSKYMYLDPSRAPCDTQVLWINGAAWNKLPDEFKKIVSMANDKIAREYYINSIKPDIDAIEKFKKLGTKVNKLPSDILNLLNKKAAEYYSEESAKNPEFKMLYNKSKSWKKICDSLEIK